MANIVLSVLRISIWLNCSGLPGACTIQLAFFALTVTCVSCMAAFGASTEHNTKEGEFIEGTRFLGFLPTYPAQNLTKSVENTCPREYCY